MKSTLLNLLVGLAVFAACSQSSDPDTTEYLYTQKDGSIQVDHTDLNYTLAVPVEKTAGSGPYPLVLALHYGGEVDEEFGKDFLEVFILPALQELNAIFVAPVSPVKSSWNNATCNKAVMALIENVVDEYDVDTSRTLVTGYSMGGSGAWYFGIKHQDFFKAMIPVSGSIPARLVSEIEDLPIYVVHGYDDEIFPFAGIQEDVEDLEEDGVDITLETVFDYTHYEIGGFINPLKGSIFWLVGRWDDGG